MHSNVQCDVIHGYKVAPHGAIRKKTTKTDPHPCTFIVVDIHNVVNHSDAAKNRLAIEIQRAS